MKLLIGILSPRDIPDFLTAIDKVQQDKYWVKYYPYIPNDPYGSIKKFFLKNEEYTHLAILPDDLIPTPEGVEQLLQDVREGGMDYIGAVCPVNSLENEELMAVCHNIVGVSRDNRQYNWIKRQDIPNGIFEVKHHGMVFPVMSRRLVEKLSFTGDRQYNLGGKDNRPTAYDVVMCGEMEKLGIPRYVDGRVIWRHLRYGGEIKVGKLPPTAIHQKVGENNVEKAVDKAKLSCILKEFNRNGGTGMPWVDNLIRLLVKNATDQSVPLS